jgi:hypothetical protein
MRLILDELRDLWKRGGVRRVWLREDLFNEASYLTMMKTPFYMRSFDGPHKLYVYGLEVFKRKRA